MDKVFVERLSLPARVGVYSHEHGREQPIELDIEVDYDGGLSRAARSERLRDTINYEKLAKVARRVVAERHYALVETLATEIANAVLKLRPAQRARVRLRKLGCLEDAVSAGTEVVIERSEVSSAIVPIDAFDPLSAEPIAVVGAGVAGLAAMLWLHRLGHTGLLIDPATTLGGQLSQVHARMPDIPGLDAMTGGELAARLCRQLPRTTRWLQANVARLEIGDACCELDLRRGDESYLYRPRVAIVSTGWRRRTLTLDQPEQPDRFVGRGILQTASKDIARLAGEPVVVVGGGDAACENALKLANAGARVVLVHRGIELSARRQFRELVARRLASTNRRGELVVRLGARVARLEGHDHLERVVLAAGEQLEARWLLVRIGWQPNAELLPARFVERGYGRVDARLRAVEMPGARACPRLLIAGDVRNPAVPAVATSIGDGACAAKAAVELVEVGASDDRSCDAKG